MTPPRFQFTIRGLLWATFWVALTAAAWRYGVITPMTPRLLQGVAIGVIFLAPLLALLSVFGRSLLAFGLWLGWIVLLLIPSVPAQ